MSRISEEDFSIHSRTNYESLKALIGLCDMVINEAQFLQPAQADSAAAAPLRDPSSPCPQPNTSSKSSTRRTPTRKAKTTSPLASRADKPTTVTTPSLLSPPRSTAATSAAPSPTADFDARVDALAAHFRALHDRVHDNNSPARKEARTAADALAKRLSHAVRRRAPPKTSIFDDPDVRRRLGLAGTVEEEQARRKDLGRQRDFMKGWAAASSAKKGAAS